MAHQTQVFAARLLNKDTGGGHVPEGRVPFHGCLEATVDPQKVGVTGVKGADVGVRAAQALEQFPMALTCCRVVA